MPLKHFRFMTCSVTESICGRAYRITWSSCRRASRPIFCVCVDGFARSGISTITCSWSLKKSAGTSGAQNGGTVVRTREQALSEFDLYLFAEGTHHRAYEKLGAHTSQRDGRNGVHFAVWAPNAKLVSVIGDFNRWNPVADVMRRSPAGIWEGFIPDIGQGAVYKYHLESQYGDYKVDKADPYGFAVEIRPHTASRVWALESYSWNDHSWMAGRCKNNSLNSPLSIYEVHLGSWKRVPEEGNRWLTYRELAAQLAEYVLDAGFTHVELLPITE